MWWVLASIWCAIWVLLCVIELGFTARTLYLDAEYKLKGDARIFLEGLGMGVIALIVGAAPLIALVFTA